MIQILHKRAAHLGLGFRYPGLLRDVPPFNLPRKHAELWACPGLLSPVEPRCREGGTCVAAGQIRGRTVVNRSHEDLHSIFLLPTFADSGLYPESPRALSQQLHHVCFGENGPKCLELTRQTGCPEEGRLCGVRFVGGGRRLLPLPSSTQHLGGRGSALRVLPIRVPAHHFPPCFLA